MITFLSEECDELLRVDALSMEVIGREFREHVASSVSESVRSKALEDKGFVALNVKFDEDRFRLCWKCLHYLRECHGLYHDCLSTYSARYCARAIYSVIAEVREVPGKGYRSALIRERLLIDGDATEVITCGDPAAKNLEIESIGFEREDLSCWWRMVVNPSREEAKTCSHIDDNIVGVKLCIGRKEGKALLSLVGVVECVHDSPNNRHVKEPRSKKGVGDG